MISNEIEHFQRMRKEIMHRDLQIFDIKQLADFEHFYKIKCLESIRAYKNWKKIYRQQTDVLELLYGSVKGIMLRRQAEDSIRLYWMVRQDMRQALASYLSHRCCFPSYIKAAEVQQNDKWG